MDIWRLYKKLEYRAILLVVGANALGAGLVFGFLRFIYPLPVNISPVQTGAQPIEVLTFLAVTTFLIALGFLLGPKNERKLSIWVRKLAEGQARAEEIPDDVRKVLLQTPHRTAITTLLMWGLASVMFSFGFTYAPGGFSWEPWLAMMTGVFLVGGVLTSVIVLFGIELIWRPMLPYLFPSGDVQPFRTRSISVLGRLLIAFLVVTLWPMLILVFLSLQRARSLLVAPDPVIVLRNLVVMEVFILTVSLLFSVSVALFVTRIITQPLRFLQRGMNQVEKGDFKVRLPVLSTDELGYLTGGFNQMVAGLQQGERMRNLLNLYVTPEVARAAIEHGANLGGSQVECTVLFSDIRDFTGLSERLSPMELIATLNRYMTMMIAVVMEHGGMVNKFGGDSLLAVFGTPLNPAADHAARAVRVALGMQQALVAFNAEQRARSAPELQIGIGVATGAVVAGNVGGQERIEYTVIGDTVNLAARLQEKSKELKQTLVLHKETFVQAQTVLGLVPSAQQSVEIRGKHQLVEIVLL
ncbi:MAG: HAMP domain-containing protein [Anaerolinea sp.]|nr:HAMP domain-containing protein [Anaerolinea sp.]